METLPPCEHCGKPAKLRCGRCRAVALCSRECQAAAWRRHKPDCQASVAARAQLEALGVSPAEPNGPISAPSSLSGKQLLALDARATAVYERHGLEQPPPKDSLMPVRKKLAFFLDMLQAHDTSAPENAALPLGARLLLNRRYNNTYRRAVDTFAPGELDRLHAQMRARHIGASFK